MRLVLPALLATLAMAPAFAQQVSPMTGTTSTTPSIAPAAPATAGTTGAAAATATRPRHHRMTMQQRFDAANTSHDGKLTLEQAKAGHVNRVAEHFDAIDTGKKGYVTMDDIHAFNRAQRQARKAAK